MTSLLFAPLLGPLPWCTQARVRRGGWRQRQAMEQPGQAAVIDNGFIGRLGSGMFLDFCDGEITAYRLCKHMQHAVQDGSECRLSKALGKIGTLDSAVCRSNRGAMRLMSSLPVLGIISRLPGSCQVSGGHWTCADRGRPCACCFGSIWSVDKRCAQIHGSWLAILPCVGVRRSPPVRPRAGPPPGEEEGRQ